MTHIPIPRENSLLSDSGRCEFLLDLEPLHQNGCSLREIDRELVSGSDELHEIDREVASGSDEYTIYIQEDRLCLYGC